MEVIGNKWVDQRLDKVVMHRMDVPWSAAHKMVRAKGIYVRKPGTKENVYKKVGYKIEKGDLLCITDRLLRQEETQRKQRARQVRVTRDKEGYFGRDK